ncbi:hypothetical protein VP01_2119g2 [Puccinia sorghi]|uniref:Uncharacterized protein n=1 Tax=Puccinia sorghi TaxID=27349 RepID=A0A0L6VBU3_9BASI|nr:hypothetical protein VP01_2119g2 [Puccinia sorghi]
MILILPGKCKSFGSLDLAAVSIITFLVLWLPHISNKVYLQPSTVFFCTMTVPAIGAPQPLMLVPVGMQLPIYGTNNTSITTLDTNKPIRTLHKMQYEGDLVGTPQLSPTTTNLFHCCGIPAWQVSRCNARSTCWQHPGQPAQNEIINSQHLVVPTSNNPSLACITNRKSLTVVYKRGSPIETITNLIISSQQINHSLLTSVVGGTPAEKICSLKENVFEKLDNYIFSPFLIFKLFTEEYSLTILHQTIPTKPPPRLSKAEHSLTGAKMDDQEDDDLCGVFIGKESIFRDFGRLSKLSVAEKAVFGGSGGHWRSVGKTRFLLESAAGGKTGSGGAAKRVQGLHSRNLGFRVWGNVGSMGVQEFGGCRTLGARDIVVDIHLINYPECRQKQ